MSTPTGKFIPNSFQCPNEYVDSFMYLLTGEEFKVLAFATRRIAGFNGKRHDRISISQFQNGTGHGDGGTGLSRQTIVNALSVLVKYGLLIKMADNDITRNEGAMYTLQLDATMVDVAGLEERLSIKREVNRKRFPKGEATPEPESESEQSEQPVYLTDDQPSLSDRPAPVCPTDDPSLSDGQTINTRNPLETHTGESEKIPDEIPVEGKKPAAEVYKESVKKALERGYAAHAGGLDLGAYPEDTREIIRAVCDIWRIRPPTKNKKKGGEFSLWIQSARDLREACAEFGIDVLKRLYDESVTRAEKDGGIPPYLVASPGSLLKPARAMAGRMRLNPSAQVVVPEDDAGGVYL